MIAETVERILSEFGDREPFHPFEIELTNEKRLFVDMRGTVGFRDGTAVFLGPAIRIEIFTYDEIVAIRDLDQAA